MSKTGLEREGGDRGWGWRDEGVEWRRVMRGWGEVWRQLYTERKGGMEEKR